MRALYWPMICARASRGAHAISGTVTCVHGVCDHFYTGRCQDETFWCCSKLAWKLITVRATLDMLPIISLPYGYWIVINCCFGFERPPCFFQRIVYRPACTDHHNMSYTYIWCVILPWQGKSIPRVDPHLLDPHELVSILVLYRDTCNFRLYSTVVFCTVY